MVEMVSEIANISKGYDGYIVEVKSKYELEDEVTRALDNNLKNIGRGLDKDHVYVRPLTDEVKKYFHRQIYDNVRQLSLPALLIMDTHPNELVGDSVDTLKNIQDYLNIFGVENRNKAILIELGELESESEVTQVLEKIMHLAQSDSFMQQLTIEQRKQELNDELDSIMEGFSSPAQIALSIISIYS